MSDIMLDIETLGNTPGCIVLSIGAVEFTSDLILDSFEVFIDPLDSERMGCHMDASTVMWWLDQDKLAQEALTGHQVNTLEEALSRLNSAFNWDNKRIWCNGASFDFPILNALYKKCGMQTPWKFWNEMDMRTIKNAVGRSNWKKVAVTPSIAHSALADADSQARTLMNVFSNKEVMKWVA